MFNWEPGFDRQWYLALLLLLPVLWVFSFRSLAGLGNLRRFLAITLRSLVFTLFVFALAEFQLRQVSEKLTVLYLLDQSESIPAAKRQLMLDYVVQAVRLQRDHHREDRAGVIVFGREAAIEVPPFDDDIPTVGGFETFLGSRDATNLEAALKLAQASFPEDTAKRIVVVTDGNENLGSARSIAPLLGENGIGIDVVPVKLTTRAEVAIEKITLPQDIRRGQPIDARVVLNNYMEADQGNPVRGKLRITRTVGGKEELVGQEQSVELPPGKTVIKFQHTIDNPAMYTYRALFSPDDPADDLMPQNNEATTFTHVRGKGRLLLIEDAAEQGKFTYLIERLNAMNLEIDVLNTGNLFTSLAELQGYDCVILADVPRSSGDDFNTVNSFSDEQILMLVRNVEQMGSGLIMIGGPNSFGAGGWANTELEKAMPVEFQIKNAKIQAVGALVLMMHASEMPQGNHWQKVVAREAIKSLGPMDYCGLIHWDNFGGDAWLWGGKTGLLRVTGRRNMMLAALNRMAPGDMPDFEPSLKMAFAGFQQVNASVKHMIVISDGDPSPPFNSTIQRYKDANIKISTVAVGTHGPAGSTPLQNIATATGGSYYVVTNPKALPKIYQREARRVARPLVKDLEDVPPQRVYPLEMMEGIEGPFPPLRGMVLTTLKENPLVEVGLRSPDPADPENSTVLAAWTYRNGRTVVFTTDAGHLWANAWTQWESYDKFFSQMVRWAMRPVNDEDKFTVSSDVRDGKVRVVINALDQDDQYLDFLTLDGSAMGPDLEPFTFKIRQESPGRYVGEFDASKAGSYHVTVGRGAGKAPILAGVNVPYSSEYRHRDTNVALLEELVKTKPEGGQPGQLIGTDLAANRIDELLTVNTFRHNLPRAITSQDVWPITLLIAAVLFFADVFVRRVAFSYEWIAPIVTFMRERILGRPAEHDFDDRLERLRSRKAAVKSEMDERRAATRFEPVEEVQPPSEQEVRQALQGVGDAPRSAPTKRPQTSVTPGQADEESYTSRLLKAKKRAWDDKQSE